MTQKRKIFFGERLRTLRLEKGLTQKQLGEQVGLSCRMIVHYERHATRPPADKVVALAKALGLSVNELVSPTLKRPPSVSPRFARKLEKAKLLPPEDQTILAGIIDGFLRKNGLVHSRKKKRESDEL